MGIVAYTHALKAFGRDLMNNSHEPETPWIRQLLRPQDAPVCLHLGASDGRHSFAMVKAAPKAKVYAVEPASFNVEVLKYGIGMRGLGGRVIPIHGAVGESAGTLELVTPQKSTGKRARAYAFINDGSATDRADFQGVGHFTESVEVIKLDDYGLDRVDFIRMDIEGAEMAAMRGAMTILERDRPNGLFEIHPIILKQRFGSSAEEFAALFRGLGYRFFALKDGHVIEKADLTLDHHNHPDYGDFFFLHPSRELPPGEFRDLMAEPAKVAA